MTACLTSAEIEGLLVNSLPPADKARADAHSAQCEKCRKALEESRAAQVHLFKDLQNPDMGRAPSPTTAKNESDFWSRIGWLVDIFCHAHRGKKHGNRNGDCYRQSLQ